MDSEQFHVTLKKKIAEYCHLVYKITRTFPKDELYGLTSQFRRATISIALNYIEGYARGKTKVHKNFLEISYGSLKESMFLLDFCFDEEFISKTDYTYAKALSHEIAAMIWGILRKI